MVLLPQYHSHKTWRRSRVARCGLEIRAVPGGVRILDITVELWLHCPSRFVVSRFFHRNVATFGLTLLQLKSRALPACIVESLIHLLVADLSFLWQLKVAKRSIAVAFGGLRPVKKAELSSLLEPHKLAQNADLPSVLEARRNLQILLGPDAAVLLQVARRPTTYCLAATEESAVQILKWSWSAPRVVLKLLWAGLGVVLRCGRLVLEGPCPSKKFGCVELVVFRCLGVYAGIV